MGGRTSGSTNHPGKEGTGKMGETAPLNNELPVIHEKKMRTPPERVRDGGAGAGLHRCFRPSETDGAVRAGAGGGEPGRHE